MKFAAMTVGLLFCSGFTAAQQTAMVQMQCHDLASNGNFIASDEVLVNGMACRTVKGAPAASQPAAQPAQIANVAPAVAANAAGAKQPVATDVPTSTAPNA